MVNISAVIGLPVMALIIQLVHQLVWNHPNSLQLELPLFDLLMK